MLSPLLIFLGAGCGGLLRYFLGSALQSSLGGPGASLGGTQGVGGAGGFPVGTLIVNLTGCLCMGYLATALGCSIPIRAEYRLAILTGLLGGYTTFSSFSLETLQLISAGRLGAAALYILLSNTLCLLAVWVGYKVAGGSVHASAPLSY